MESVPENKSIMALSYFQRELNKIDLDIVCARNRDATELVDFYNRKKIAYIEAEHALRMKLRSERNW